MKIKNGLKAVYYSKIGKAIRKYPQKLLFTYRNRTEIRQLRSLKKGKELPIKVAFVLEYPEVWNASKTVFEYMVQSPDFEPYIFACPQYPDLSLNQASVFAKENGIRAVEGFSNGEWTDLKNLAPDYVFYTRPYEKEYPDLLKPKNVSKYAKLCYITYGFAFVKGYHLEVEYNLKTFPYTYMVFCDGPSSYEHCNKIYGSRISKEGKKIFNIGYPRFDLLYSALQKNLNSNEEKTVILWTPRWSLDGISNDGTSFFELYNPILEYVQNNDSVRLIIRPHPLMFKNFIKNGRLTIQQVESIYKEVDKLKNAEFDTEFDYLNTVLKADIIISDFSSLLIEYFILNKPVIYCGRTRSFDEIGKKISKTMYLLNDKKDLSIILENYFANGDTLKKKRISTRNEIVGLLDGKIGRRIAQEIKKDWQEAFEGSTK